MMIGRLLLCLFIVTQEVLCTGTPCDGSITAKTKDGKTCYVCGKSKLPTPTELRSTAHEVAATGGDFPWYAAIYTHDKSTKEWKHRCEGTLVSPQAVLTLARCVSVRNSDPLEKLKIEDMKVVLGKIFKSRETLEPYEKRRRVTELRVHPEYKDRFLAYASNDVALIFLDSPVPSNRHVMPACLDFSLNQSPLYKNDAVGYVTGICHKIENKPACPGSRERLLYINPKVTTIEPCVAKFEHLPVSTSHLSTPDYFCADNGTVSAVQDDDFGAGLTMVSQGLHYVTGMFSVKIRGRDYNYGVFTNVSRHMDWLKNNLPE